MSISFSHFKILCTEALDRTDLGRMTVRKERDPQSRRKSPAEIKRTKTTINPKTGERETKPVVQKTRKDIGKSREAGKSTAQIGAVDRSVDPKERAAKAAAAAKEERRKAALARRAAKSGGVSKPAAKPASSKETEKKATELLTKDAASKKSQTSSAPKRSYTRHDYSDAEKKAGGPLTSQEKTKIRSAKQNKTKREIYNAKKSEAWAKHERVFGSPPKGKKKTRMIGKPQKKHPPR
jgi:hypothetical protein